MAEPSFDSYDSIGCERNASDEEVVVACYRSTSSSALNEAAPRPLKTIALARQSHFLFFMISISPHLNEKLVAILANRSPITCSTMDVESATEPKSANLASTTANSSSQTERHQDEQGEPCDTSEATTEAEVSEFVSPSSSEADLTSSSEGTNADSDSEEEAIGGAYSDKTIWRRKYCCHELVDESCPNGHNTHKCTDCQSRLASGICPGCDIPDCGVGKAFDLCLDCIIREENDKEDNITFGSQDGVWRCIYCQWEAEADNDEKADCHCLEPRKLDLRGCLDDKPADSCSSDSESSDEEPDSEDDHVIDDENIDLGVDLRGRFDPQTGTSNLAAIPESDLSVDLVIASISSAYI